MSGARNEPRHGRWAAANAAHLAGELRCLRLRLQRHALWVRHRMAGDPLAAHRATVVSDAEVDALLADEPRAARADFLAADPAAAKVERELAAAEAAQRESGAIVREAGAPPAIDALARRFGLGRFERGVVLLALAVHTDAAFERVYAYAQDDAARPYATPGLAVALLAAGDDRGEAAADAAWNAFLPQAPLRRFGLVRLDDAVVPAGGLAGRPLVIEDRVADYVRGVNRADTELETLLDRVPAAPIAPEHADLVTSLGRWIELEAGDGRWPAVDLVGGRSAGLAAVARAACEGLGLVLHRIDPGALPERGHERRATLRLLEREAVLGKLAYFVESGPGGDRDAGDPTAVADLARHLDALLIVGGEERVAPDREAIVLTVPAPGADGQRAVWQQALNGAGPDAQDRLDAIVAQFELAPAEVTAAVAVARGRARLRLRDREAAPTADELWQACREQAGWRVDELAQRIVPAATWDDIVLPPGVLRQLRELAAQVEHRSMVYGAWGFGERLSRGRGIAALFAGPSGTGKTMAAEVLADHLSLDLHRIDLSGVVNKYVGETEKNLRRVFDAAERSGAILLFDEADALFGKRTDVKDGHDRYNNIEINYLLQRMEDYRGLAVLATNRKAALDTAFLRRLRFVLDFPFPEADSRRAIWERVFPPDVPRGELDLGALARLEVSGATIRNIALGAAFLAAAEGSQVEMGHLTRAAQREYGKLEKLLTAAEFADLREGAPA